MPDKLQSATACDNCSILLQRLRESDQAALRLVNEVGTEMAKAIMEERERCAAIAEEQAGYRIALAIRDPTKQPSPPSQPEGSPVGAGSSAGPQECTRINCPGKLMCDEEECPLAKSPNTVRESRAVKNAGERRGGKS